jgi:hypothetical protein
MAPRGRAYWTYRPPSGPADGRSGETVTRRSGRKPNSAVEGEVPRRGDADPTTPSTTIGDLRHAVNVVRVSGAAPSPRRVARAG